MTGQKDRSPLETPRKRRPLPTLTLSRTRGDVLFLLLLPLAALVLLETFARGSFAAMLAWAKAKPVFFLQNLGFYLGVFWLLALIPSDRARLCASLSLALLCCVLGIVSFYKVRYRFEPILLSDLWLLAELPHAMGQLDLRIDWGQAARVMTLGLAVIGLALVFFRGRRAKSGFLWPMLGLALMAALTPGCSFDRITQGSNTSLADCAHHGGTVFALVAAERQRQSIASFSYQEPEVDQAWQRIQGAASRGEGTGQSPNVILILSESFTDQAHLEKYLDFTRPLMPFYDQLIQGCATGEIYVPKQGGGTSETEFEVLTGLQSRYSVNPYSIGIPPLRSLAAALRERGYYASAIHWFNGIFYNRYKNLRLLGFDEFSTLETTRRSLERTGMFVSDREHYRWVLEKLKATQEKDFIFCITMQNHGTYGYDDFAQTYGADTPFGDSLSVESQQILRNYCYLLGQSDQALEGLIRELSAFPEPTVVAFFGDHIPPLGIEVYEELGMPMEGEAGHLCPYFIWSNQGDLSQRLPPMKAWQFGAHVLALAGLGDDPFFGYIEELRAKGLDTDPDYDLLSYDALFGKQRAYALAGIQPQSPDWQIGGKMELLGFDTFPMDGAVYVMPRLADPAQSFRLAVNGQALNDWLVLDTRDPFTLQCVMTSPEGKQLNQTESVSFASSQELLEQSGRLQAPALALEKVPFHMEKEEGGFWLAVSDEPFGALASCLTLEGKRQEWQFPYGFRRPGQYYVGKEAAPLSLTIRKESFREYEPTPEGLAAYFRDQKATLWLFE